MRQIISRLSILFILFQQFLCDSFHFPHSNHDQSIDYTSLQNSPDEDVQESDVYERSAFNSPDIGSFSRGSNERDTMFLKSNFAKNQQGILWPSNMKQEQPFYRSKRSLMPSPSPSPSPSPPLPPPFMPPFPLLPPELMPMLLPPPYPMPLSSKKTNSQLRRRSQNPYPADKSDIESRNGLIIKPLQPKYNPPTNYAENDECVYHTLVNGDSEILLRKILPIRMRGRTLVRTCINPVPDAKDPRYKTILRGGQKHSFGNVNLSMKF